MSESQTNESRSSLESQVLSPDKRVALTLLEQEQNDGPTFPPQRTDAATKAFWAVGVDDLLQSACVIADAMADFVAL